MLLLMLSGIFQVSEGQVTLQQIHNYEAGNQRTYQSVDPGLMDPQPGGTNQNWDFSDWPEGARVSQQVTSANGAPEGEAFPKANIAVKYGKNTRYLKKEPGGNKIQGFAGRQGGQKIQITYLNPIRPYKRPFNYSEVHRDTGRRQYQIMSLTYKGTGFLKTEAIGFGTLNLPSATYDSVVLLRNEQTWNDTPSVPIGGLTSTKMVTYSWYQSGKPQPLLRLDSLKVQSSVINDTSANLIYFKQPTTSVETPSKKTLGIRAFVNGGQLTITSRSGKANDLRLQLYTMNGKPIKQFRAHLSAGRQTFPLPPLAKGIYLLKATPKGSPRKPVLKKIPVY
jgi:hypothetical protein